MAVVQKVKPAKLTTSLRKRLATDDTLQVSLYETKTVNSKYVLYELFIR